MKYKHFIVAALCGIALLASCKKNDATAPPTPVPALAVTAINPASGP